MFPAQGRDVGQELGRDFEAGFAPGEDGVAELQRFPADDDRGQQVEAGDAVVLPFAVSVPQFATLVEMDGALEGMVRLTLVLIIAERRGVFTCDAERR